MERRVWESFCRLREQFRAYCDTLDRETPGLRAAQQALIDARGGPAYPVETPVLYNFRMDDITPDDDIKLILVADNPGRREQAAENRRYLVGPSGKIAAGFFRQSMGGIDFDRNVLLLNKTPVHTPRTVELRELCRLGGEAVAATVERSQRFMASLLLEFQRCLGAPVWITGYSEMKRKGIFETYTESLKEIYGAEAMTAATAGKPALRGRIFLYRHFSMNQFTIDLEKQRQDGEALIPALERIGRAYRKRVLGW